MHRSTDHCHCFSNCCGTLFNPVGAQFARTGALRKPLETLQTASPPLLGVGWQALGPWEGERGRDRLRTLGLVIGLQAKRINNIPLSVTAKKGPKGYFYFGTQSHMRRGLPIS